MILTLEITGAEAAQPGADRRKTFRGAGGTIGRLAENDWVLAHPYVSSRHALIRYVNGAYFIEDMSTNGVFINSLDHRLPRGQPYALQPDDRIIIDPYEIRVSIASGKSDAADPFAFDDPFGTPAAVAPPAQMPPPPELMPRVEPMPGEVVDPIDLLGLKEPARPADAPKAADLARGSVLKQHYQAPSPVSPPPSATPQPPSALIPDSYDPSSTDESMIVPAPPPIPPARPSGRSRAVPAAAAPPVEASHPSPQDTPPQDTPPRPVAPPPGARRSAPRSSAAPGATAPPFPEHGVDAPAFPERAADAPPAMRPRTAAPGVTRPEGDLAGVLAGAGLEGVAVTPELARNFGEILRVVISGVMDVLQARQRIKDEFRLGMTTFKAADNNPLKFSANVEDALHNLLVKRNAAYLGPVEAFEDAFDDVRNHQMAMLAGVRMAFEAMLADFDPERLEEQFDRQLKTGALLSVPAKLRYWDLYRSRFRDMVKDPETSFRELFGDEFASAYEQQLERLRAQRRAGKR